MKNLLITGGTGYFARAMAKRALEEGIQRVCIFSRGEAQQAAMRAEFEDHPCLRWFIGDVRDKDRLALAMRGCDVVVHAAALKRIEIGVYNPTEMVKTNVIGAMNVAEAALQAGVRRVVGLSTDKAWQPISPYGQSKALAESILLGAHTMMSPDGPEFVVVRYGNVMGSTGSVLPRWTELRRLGVVTAPVTAPECTRFWMSRAEAVDLVWRAAAPLASSRLEAGQLLIPRDLPAFRLRDLVEAMGFKFQRITGLPKWEKLHEGMDDGVTSDIARRLTVDQIRERIKEEGL